MSAHRILRFLAVLAVIVLAAAACGGGDDDASTGSPNDASSDDATDDTATDATAETTTDDATDDTATDATAETTTDDAPDDDTATSDGGDDDEGAPPATAAPDTTIVEGTETAADGTTVVWRLHGDADELCFEASLANPDATIATTLGNGVDDCLRPSSGLDDLADSLIVDVGTVDGSRRFGYVWGRAAADVTSLVITANDGSTTTVELLDGPTEVQVFAYLGVIDEIAPVITLDAATAAGSADSEPIRDFLRTGPTYPTVPPVTVPPVSYPTAN